MIQTTQMVLEQLSKEYSNPKMKLNRLVKEGKYIPIIRGLYETDPNLDGKLLADIIYSPSYLSFDYALSYYGLIPERVEAYTSATCKKRRSKCYITPFGRYTYRDVPSSVFMKEIKMFEVREYTYWIASPEKTLCDKFYTLPRVKNLKDMELTLLDDLRIYEDDLDEMDPEIIADIAKDYRSHNVAILSRYMSKRLG
jgi:predicted transcriptional regulator of viral defense system